MRLIFPFGKPANIKLLLTELFLPIIKVLQNISQMKIHQKTSSSRSELSGIYSGFIDCERRLILLINQVQIRLNLKLFLSILFLVLIPISKAQSNEPAPSAKNHDATIRIAIMKNNPPFSFILPNGKPAGLYIVRVRTGNEYFTKKLIVK